MTVPGSYFASDYAAARVRFRDAVAAAGGQLTELALDSKGPDGADLTIDIGWFGSERPRRALVHCSGIHGVEGFAGSAIQLQHLDDGVHGIPTEDAVVLVHSLNPYGMAWLRRFNEHNVDLNRNFLAPSDAYSGVPAGYERFNRILNPESPPARDLFYLQALWQIARHGIPSLKEAIVSGQYEHPKGLFFGGAELQQGPQLFEHYVRERLRTANRVVVVDIHTGLGKRGQDAILVEAPLGDSDMYREIEEAFGHRVAPLDARQSVAYQFRGAFYSMFDRALPDARVYFVAQEFGTYREVRVLKALREENRWHQYGSTSVDHPTKRILRERFCPEDATWRTTVLARGSQVLHQAHALSFSHE